ncbi:exodeoxyribonuclease V subunit beta [Conchiformibius steedae]|uniref:RecBCD enzyme subunit RecB n=1 Tax=Conchiformibius steedae TaxID=153493 RepID=A0A3P2ADA8_9NEIS|nr:exodeoxyribonuclease V subunit beta [Conchiformibius steedae]RRD91623.1 exodeoxyribonuclease V subunit beta [Conchiformibius steedae]
MENASAPPFADGETMTVPFAPLDVPLNGTNLIEASAGTGKTWNIAALFARLVVLEQADVSQILVVTFTKAATAELKTRLRARLDEALNVLRRCADADNPDDALIHECGGDDFLYRLLQRGLQQEGLARLMLRLQAAVSGFDNASVYTIHGFCQRVLQDYAFFCQVPFDIELDEQGDRAENLNAAQDFWRGRIADDDVWAQLSYRRRYTPQQALDELESYIARPYLHTPVSAQAQDFAAAQARLAELWQNTVAQLPEIEAAFWRIHPSLNSNVFRINSFTDKFAMLHQLSTQHAPDAATLRQLLQHKDGHLLFDEGFVREKVKKNALAPEPSDLDQIQILAELGNAAAEAATAETAAWADMQRQLLTYLRESRRVHKQSHPRRVFDDLLLDVAAALAPDAPHAHTLARALSAQWRFALIDEFQDTDPLQYAIFRTAFAATGTPLFLVGDPKQAIYGFRGADIFAYLQAAGDAAERHYTLDTNRRNHQALNQGIDALFARVQPFVLPQIAYPPVRASREVSRLHGADDNPALAIRWLNEGSDNAAVLEARAADWSAAETAALLGGSHTLDTDNGTRPLLANDIAILVRRRKDGELVRRALKKHGIQSVLLSQNNIFAEAEAEACAALLDFFIQPQQSDTLNFVLAGCLFQYSAADLQALNDNEHQRSAWTDSAQRSLAHWQQAGIYAALQHFCREHGVETRLLAQRNERSLTNLHQVMELLAAEDELSHSPVSLQQWLHRQIESAKQGSGTQAHTLRLESDNDLVKIVTIHASKGLQYPVVICPFIWKAAAAPRSEWHIVHRGSEAVLLHDSQFDEADRKQQQREHLSEDLRLLYVALTRAEERLYLYAGAYRDGKNSAPAYLLDMPDKTATNDNACREHWQQFAQTHGLTWYGHQAPSAVRADWSALARPVYRAAEYAPRRFGFIRHTSFTGLLRQSERLAAARAELPPSDSPADLPDPAPLAPTADAEGIHAFPHGSNAGICLHALLEHRLFAPADPAADALILERYGIDPEQWCDTVGELLQRTRHTPLLPDRTTLADFSPQQRLTETEFVLHTDFRLADIRRLLAHSGLSPHIIQAAAALQFQDLHGYLNGAIDLMCRTADGRVLIIDYKSNRLGDHAAAYTPAALDEAVADHHYYLQALIYSIAAARYLHSRHALPEQIGVRYLFLRGLDGYSSHSVWSWDIHTADLSPWLIV